MTVPVAPLLPELGEPAAHMQLVLLHFLLADSVHQSIFSP